MFNTELSKRVHKLEVKAGTDEIADFDRKWDIQFLKGQVEHLKSKNLALEAQLNMLIKYLDVEEVEPSFSFRKKSK